MNQVLFRVGESNDLLSNQVWNLFLSMIDGKKSIEKLGSSRSLMEKREKSTLLFFHELND